MAAMKPRTRRQTHTGERRRRKTPYRMKKGERRRTMGSGTLSRVVRFVAIGPRFSADVCGLASEGPSAVPLEVAQAPSALRSPERSAPVSV